MPPAAAAEPQTTSGIPFAVQHRVCTPPVSRSGTVEIYSVAQGAAAAQLFERLPAVAMLHRAAVRTHTCIGVQMAKADRAGFGRPLASALAAASGGLSAGAAAAAPVPAAPGKNVKATPFLVQLSIGGGGVIVTRTHRHATTAVLMPTHHLRRPSPRCPREAGAPPPPRTLPQTLRPVTTVMPRDPGPSLPPYTRYVIPLKSRSADGRW